MALELVFVAAGLVILLLAGDALVKGAVNLSLRLGIPAGIVGLTVVAFGTSAPELLVSVQAVLGGAPGLALGNVVGSNIANVLLVLGLPALIAAVPVARADAGRDTAVMLAATALFIALAALGPIRWPHAAVLLAALALMLTDAFLRAQAHRRTAGEPRADELEGADPGASGFRVAVSLLLGVLGLPLGAALLVDGAVDLAARLGVSDAVIGLTIVAVGTSLPELATTVMAALRREAGVALGNIIGSNSFNLLCIIGVAGMVGPIPVPPGILAFDLWVMAGASVVLGLFVLRSRNIGRWVGAAFLACYGLYLAALVMGIGA